MNIYNHAIPRNSSFKTSLPSKTTDVWFLGTNGAKNRYDSLYSTRDLWPLNQEWNTSTNPLNFKNLGYFNMNDFSKFVSNHILKSYD